jgi:DNA-directed RNA polymerase subunit M
MFCPKCGSILRPKVEKGKKLLACGCGYVSQPKEGLTFRETVRTGQQRVEVVSEEKSILPKTKAVCPKCGHDTAFYWMVQTRAGDEPETKFLRCEKCKKTWRDYS